MIAARPAPSLGTAALFIKGQICGLERETLVVLWAVGTLPRRIVID